MKGRRGYSLLEVVLAMAVLVVVLLACGRLITLGAGAAADAQDLTRAQLHCESISAALAAGILPAETVQEVSVLNAWEATGRDLGALLDPEDQNWFYSVEIEPTDVPNMMLMRVTVAEKRQEGGGDPVSVSISRWIRDPAVLAAQAEAEAAAEAEATSE